MRDPDERVKARLDGDDEFKEPQHTRREDPVKKIDESSQEVNRGWKSRLLGNVCRSRSGQASAGQVSGGSDKGQVTPDA